MKWWCRACNETTDFIGYDEYDDDYYDDDDDDYY